MVDDSDHSSKEDGEDEDVTGSNVMTCDPVTAGADVMAVTLTIPEILASDSEDSAFDDDIVIEEADTGAAAVRG